MMASCSFVNRLQQTLLWCFYVASVIKDFLVRRFIKYLYISYWRSYDGTFDIKTNPAGKNLFKVREVTLEQWSTDLCSNVIFLVLNGFLPVGKWFLWPPWKRRKYNCMLVSRPVQSHSERYSFVILLTLNRFLSSGL